jgi:hypothetical protein
MHARLEWKPADCWIGLYTERRRNVPRGPNTISDERHVWICLVPMLPLHLWWPAAG